ncbi:class I adenylate-forming enzyme family protein [Thermoplasma sp.]|uniref:class I adenylate-forming enzyme family protein n=1 Tax=Thermoplasma sp. TaxID=1973142 RepID=UPI0012707FFA|nr:class I adenylate-forming enzyme family protein [Thermoplasma sp.]KAA8922131.1 MAG: acyl--CoA ligase [Thermoplasma sp.]
MDMGTGSSIYDAFAAVAQNNESRVAIYFMGKPLTYHNILSMSDSLAHNLEEMGIDRNVAIMAGNSPQFIVSILALNSIGLAAELLRPGESPESSGSEYVIASDYMLNYRDFNFRDMFLIRDEDFAPYGTSLRYYFREYLGDRPDLSSHPGIHRFSDLVFDKVARAERKRNTEDVAIVKRTGKAQSPFLLRNGDVISATQELSSYLEGFRKNIVISSSLYHMSTLQFLFMTLLNGGTVNLVPDYMDAHTTMRLAEKLDSNMILGNSNLYGQILEKRIGIPKAIRFLFMLGEDFTLEFMERFRSQTGRMIKVGYDLTALGGSVTITPIDSDYDGSMGKPLPGVKIRITDRSGRDVQSGETGFIEVSSDRFAMVSGDPFYNTGDLGFIDAVGNLHLERSRRMIINGTVIYPEPIETAALKAPGVNDIALGMRYENGLPVLVAYVVSEDLNGVKRFFNTKVPPYLRPGRYIQMRKIPRSPAGKIIREQLVEMVTPSDQKTSAGA